MHYIITWQWSADIQLLIFDPQEKTFQCPRKAESYYKSLSKRLDVIGLRRSYPNQQHV